MNIAEIILRESVNQWNKLTEEEKDNYLKNYVQSYKRKRVTKRDRQS